MQNLAVRSLSVCPGKMNAITQMRIQVDQWKLCVTFTYISKHSIKFWSNSKKGKCFCLSTFGNVIIINQKRIELDNIWHFLPSKHIIETAYLWYFLQFSTLHLLYKNYYFLTKSACRYDFLVSDLLLEPSRILTA